MVRGSVITSVKCSWFKVCPAGARKPGWRLAWVLLLAGAAPAASLDLTSAIRGIEQRYNRPRTMALRYLRRPRRMRWDYENPPGKLFLSDGNDVYFYSPAANRVEKMPLKRSGDLRTPLAFLMGRVNLRRDFREFRSRPEGADLHITALPKSDRAPYARVEFVVNSSHQIRRLVVVGQDRSVMEFRFAEEKVNPPLRAGLFQFHLPEGAEFVDLSQEMQ